MKTIPSVHPYYAHRAGSTLGKVVATIASLLTIAAIIFVGTRDWKADKSVTAILSDISDIRGLFHQVEDAGFSTTVKHEAARGASNAIERSLIENGQLVRRDTQVFAEAGTPAGLIRTGSAR